MNDPCIWYSWYVIGTLGIVETGFGCSGTDFGESTRVTIENGTVVNNTSTQEDASQLVCGGDIYVTAQKPFYIGYDQDNGAYCLVAKNVTTIADGFSECQSPGKRFAVLRLRVSLTPLAGGRSRQQDAFLQ